MGSVNTWVENIYGLPEFKAVMGNVKLCAKALKPVTIADPVKEVKKEAVVAKPVAE